MFLQAVEFHKELMSKQPPEIECADRRRSLRHALKINESDPMTIGLRIPKKNERPNDVMLASGFRSELA